MAERHIVAIGGAGFDEEAGRPLRDYILELTGEARPRICFVPTASGDAAESLVAFYSAFPARRCEPTHLSLFRRDVGDLRAFLLDHDAIYVGGGNTANLLAVWRVHGLDAIFREAWEAGVVLSGSSAGANCWFEACVTDSFGPELAPLHDGLGFLRGSMCPHYDTEETRRPTFRRLVAEGFAAGFAADDAVALHFAGTTLVAAVSARPGGRAFRVELVDGDVAETALAVRRIG